MAVNAAWHASHRMPKNATLQQRIDWHLAHQEHCACREMPKSVREASERRRR